MRGPAQSRDGELPGCFKKSAPGMLWVGVGAFRVARVVPLPTLAASGCFCKLLAVRQENQLLRERLRAQHDEGNHRLVSVAAVPPASACTRRSRSQDSPVVLRGFMLSVKPAAD